MLLLARKRGERIRIGESIEVVVTEIRRGFVRLGISAPPGVPILREEVHRLIAQENLRAAQPPGENAHVLERVLEALVEPPSGRRPRTRGR